MKTPLSLHSSSQGITSLERTRHACRILAAYAMVLGFFSNALMLAVPIYSLQVLDRVVSSGSMSTLVLLTIVVLAALVGLHVIQAFRAIALAKGADWFEQQLAGELFTKAISSSTHDKDHTAMQGLRDLGQLKQFIGGQALPNLIDAPWAIIFIMVIWWIHPVLALVVALGGVGLLGLAWLNEKTSKPHIIAANHDAVNAQNIADAAARNAEVIEGMGMHSTMTERWRQRFTKAGELHLRASAFSNSIAQCSRGLRFMLQVAVTGIGGYLVLHESMTVGGMIAGSILAGRALAPFDSAIASWRFVVTARGSYARLEDFLSDKQQRFEAMELPKPEGNIILDKVYYKPLQSEKPTIKGINVAIKAGEIIGLIGPSASGKSTLAKLMLGIWQTTSGVVRIDGADVFQWPREHFGSFTGYLPQDVELFSGSIRDNIARMDADAKAEHVIAAAKKAGTHDLILSLPQGYDTVIGEGGMTLSAGQRQRVGLARALYGEPKIVILDEPNANLDQEGEQALANAIATMRQEKVTAIIIAHRPSLMQLVDKILVLKEGELVMFNLAREVIAKLTQPGGIPQKGQGK